MNPETERHVEHLYDQATRFASELCTPGETLNPYAVTEVAEGEGQMLSVDSPVETDDAIDLLYQALQKLHDEDKLVAFAIVSEVLLSSSETGENAEGLLIAIEHREPAIVSILIPYEDSDSGREYFEPKRFSSEAQIFGE